MRDGRRLVDCSQNLPLRKGRLVRLALSLSCVTLPQWLRVMPSLLSLYACVLACMRWHWAASGGMSVVIDAQPITGGSLSPGAWRRRTGFRGTG